MSTHSIYEFVDREQVNEILESFYICIDLPIALLDKEGIRVKYYGDTCRYCKTIKKYQPEGLCEKTYTRASDLAKNLGESYIFTCNGNLNHIILPLLNNGTVVGSILAGPFLLDKPDSTLIQDIGKKYNIPTNAQFDMYDELSNVKIMPPTHVTHAARLLNYLCHDLTEKKKKPNIKQIKLHQQARIGESIQMYKDIESEGSNYPYEKEKELITKVKLGNIADAKGILNDLLGYVFFSEGNNLDAIKTRAVELSSLLSRAAIEGGAATDRILKMNNYFLRTIQQINNLEDLCYRLQEVVIEFTEAMFHQIPSKNSEVIKNAIKYITKNFSRQITLEEVASVVHLSSSYFSTLFKECTGSTFKEYLNMIRVEESKRLLSNTDYSIIDIAIATGFESQSYFTKIFKRYTGYTPKQFR
ncbi:MAG TPA: AraC family transcriptional regulator [Clostridiaceae bacterium]|jgi:two-component system response regulator YesN|nr:AraC family transcriptional regulator [Clostridiaceae bacterium]HOA30806.1 PocR ligand-binding domain-containing protein [Clostridia bacterium]